MTDEYLEENALEELKEEGFNFKPVLRYMKSKIKFRLRIGLAELINFGPFKLFVNNYLAKLLSKGFWEWVRENELETYYDGVVMLTFLRHKNGKGPYISLSAATKSIIYRSATKTALKILNKHKRPSV